jgi:hypothetical protein
MGSIVRAQNYTFFSQKGSGNHQMEAGILETGIFLRHRRVSAVKRVQSVSDRMSYIQCCEIAGVIIVSMHMHRFKRNIKAQTMVFMRNMSRCSIIFLRIIQTFCLKILMRNRAERIFPNRQLGMRVYIRTVMIIALQ